MSCPECACDTCIEAHPGTDEMLELQEIETQIARLRSLWHAVYGKPPTAEELFDPTAIAWTLTAGMLKVNGLTLGLNAGLNRLVDLMEDDA